MQGHEVFIHSRVNGHLGCFLSLTFSTYFYCIQFSCSVMSNSLQPRGLQHTRFPVHHLSIRIFSSESVLHIRWPKYWNFCFSISSSNEYSGLISFRMDWLDLLAVQGTLKSLLQHHSSKASVLGHSSYSTVHLSHLSMATEKAILWLYGPLSAK